MADFMDTENIFDTIVEPDFAEKGVRNAVLLMMKEGLNTSKIFKDAIQGAMDNWLAEHPITLSEIFEGGTKEAVKSWLKENHDELIAEIVRASRDK